MPGRVHRHNWKSIPNILITFAFALLLVVCQIAAGSDPIPASVFGGAMALWLVAFLFGGAFRSYIGILVFLWGAKIFGIALVAKVLMWESTTANLEAPRETALVYFLGFAAILAAVAIQRVLPVPRHEGLLPRLATSKEYLILGALFLVFGFVLPALIGDRVTYVAAFRALAQYRDFSILVAIHWAAARGEKQPFTHPVVLILLAVCLVLGFSGTSKQGILTPIAVYYLGVFSLSGLKHKRLFLPLIPLAFVFQLSIGPVADVMKGHAEDLSLAGRVKLMLSANWTALRHPEEIRSQLQASRTDYRLRNDYYFERDVGYLERFSLLKTGDKLVVATLRQGHTGWSTILWDLSCLPPRVIAPNKPLQSSINQLARFAGAVNDDDFGTAVSYGLFPHLFHALGYNAVVLLGFVAVAGMFWWFRLWFGDAPHLSFYGVMVIGLIHHGLAEDTLGTFLFFFYTPLVLRIALIPLELLRRMRWA